MITSLVVERAGLFASHAFVCLFRMLYFLFLYLPFGFKDWLWRMIVAFLNFFTFAFDEARLGIASFLHLKF